MNLQAPEPKESRRLHGCAVCSAKCPIDTKTCGNCPGVRVMDPDSDKSDRATWLDCASCGAVIKPMIAGTSINSLCLECYRAKEERCMHPAHLLIKNGNNRRMVPSHWMDDYVVLSTRTADKGTPYKVRCCERCRDRFKLRRWCEHEAEFGTFNLITGAKEMAGMALPLSLKGNPLDSWGGIRGCIIVPQDSRANDAHFFYNPSAYVVVDKAEVFGKGSGKTFLIGCQRPVSVHPLQTQRGSIGVAAIKSYVSSLHSNPKPNSHERVNFKPVTHVGWCFSRVICWNGESLEWHHESYQEARDDGLTLVQWMDRCLA